jgi:tetratricopeptide (TPR) repeat protein
MEDSTFRDSLLTVDMGPQYVWVKLNAERDPEGIALAEKMGVSGYPTIFLMDSDGAEIDRMDGYIPAETFKSNIEGFMTSPNSVLALRRRVEERPDSPEALYALAEAYLDRDNFSASAEIFQQLVELPTEEDHIVASAYYYLAYSLASARDGGAALEKIEALGKAFPESPVLADALVLKGQILLFEGKESQATRVFEGFLENYPEHGQRQKVMALLFELSPKPKSPMTSSH